MNSMKLLCRSTDGSPQPATPRLEGALFTYARSRGAELMDIGGSVSLVTKSIGKGQTNVEAAGLVACSFASG